MWAALCGAKASTVIMHFLSMNLVFKSKVLLGGVRTPMYVCVHVRACVCVLQETLHS